MIRNRLLRALGSPFGPLVLAVLLLGCTDKLSLDNYNQLKVGQSDDEVKLILGDPARCDEMIGVRSCVWGGDERGIKVAFMGGQVALLSAHNLK
ncbi:MAG: hypothetical protein AW11_02532 [Candidatus Accumulibacter regalis]|jgi:hypothetical protein|uniref:Lipoprotein n=1 Tax=Accumulibacter regalis TaxID=522306 RepID=A0A011R8D5_ACCRE|nr:MULTISPECIES: hypothetical protein [unclassified Candidatus Accumulibacter]EXI87404.1 MAG: hypothetical protein AW11_02532 [Candidatus Accumulibacter regalis]MBL8367249.1 hypothetical protein [Accumulibacter sp.]HRE70886.1 hypothetical protein [Accumulibacter sp.]